MDVNNAVNMSNIYSEDRDRLNRIINANNRINSNNYKTKKITLTNQITADKGLVTATQTQDRGKEGLEGGAFAGELNHIQDISGKVGAIVKKGSTAINKITTGAGKISADVNAVVSQGVKGISTANPLSAESVGQVVSKTDQVAPKGGLGTALLGSSKTAGRVDKVLKGVNILTGGIDALEDIKAKGIVGDNKLDQASNVAGIVSGGAESLEAVGAGVSAGLELAGIGLDASVIGAPVGAILGVAGIVAGGVSLLAGIGGDILDEKKDKKQTSIDTATQDKMNQQGPTTQQAIPFQSISQQGGIATNKLN